MADKPAWYERFKVFFWPALAVIFFGLFVYREIWQPALPRDPVAQEVAQAWSDSIGRLGIAPIFPPQEDFAVGDIWAVIAHSKIENDSLLSKGVRVGRLDLHS